MSRESSREKNILDDGIYTRQEVFVDMPGVHGEIIGADFEHNMVQIEINVPARHVKAVIKENAGLTPPVFIDDE